VSKPSFVRLLYMKFAANDFLEMIFAIYFFNKCPLSDIILLYS
jgi:hypothetical protein